jgi:anti-sigma-K factor RskA
MLTERWKILTLWGIIAASLAVVIWNIATMGFFASMRWNTPLFVAIIISNHIRFKIGRRA